MLIDTPDTEISSCCYGYFHRAPYAMLSQRYEIGIINMLWTHFVISNSLFLFLVRAYLGTVSKLISTACPGITKMRSSNSFYVQHHGIMVVSKAMGIGIEEIEAVTPNQRRLVPTEVHISLRLLPMTTAMRQVWKFGRCSFLSRLHYRVILCDC